jgi:hypothetical protein
MRSIGESQFRFASNYEEEDHMNINHHNKIDGNK